MNDDSTAPPAAGTAETLTPVPPGYQPPRVEAALGEADLVRESQYAGQVISGT